MTQEGWTEAFEAARAGDRASVLRMADKDQRIVQARDGEGATLLHAAAERDDVKLVLGLLDRGADPRVEAGWGQTPFEWAANMGASAVAELLRAKGGARESFWTAAALGEVDQVRRRLSGAKDAEVLARPVPPRVDPYAWPEDTAFRRGDGLSDAFYIACRNGHVEVARFLAEAGADLDARGYFGASALHWAALNGREAVVRWLIEAGAQLGQRDPKFDATPAGWAREGKRDDLAALIEGDGATDQPEQGGGVTSRGLDLEVGHAASRSLEVTPERVRSYAEITGDRNPLHFDETFAAETPFGRLVAHGGITTGVLHALVAEDMPGPGTVFLSQNWKFTAPVYIGDTITATAEVLTVHETKPVCSLDIRVVRQDGETVLEGEAWCYRFLVAAAS